MTKNLVTMLAILALAPSTFARRGEGEVERHAGKIVCTDKVANKVVLSFAISQLLGEVSTSDFDLNVKALGHNIRELNLLDKRSGDLIKAQVSEGQGSLTLKTDEGTAPSSVQGLARLGAVDLTVADPTTGDKVTMKSLHRRGQSFLEITLITDENPAKPLIISCEQAL